jgi:hypothetical protein
MALTIIVLQIRLPAATGICNQIPRQQNQQAQRLSKHLAEVRLRLVLTILSMRLAALTLVGQWKEGATQGFDIVTYHR